MGHLSPKHPRLSLLGLPAELRNTIYAFALLAEPQEYRFPHKQHASVPALLQTSRQIRDETLATYYRGSTFELIVHAFDPCPLFALLRSIDPAARAYLLSNPTCNIRVLVPTSHPDYSIFHRRLSRYYFAAPGTGAKGLIVTAEDPSLETAPVAYMLDAPRARAKYHDKVQRERRQDFRIDDNRGPMYVMANTQARGNDRSRAKLKQVLLDIWEPVEALLMGKDDEVDDNGWYAGAWKLDDCDAGALQYWGPP